jgi:hypothetical protein
MQHLFDPIIKPFLIYLGEIFSADNEADSFVARSVD